MISVIPFAFDLMTVLLVTFISSSLSDAYELLDLLSDLGTWAARALRPNLSLSIISDVVGIGGSVKIDESESLIFLESFLYEEDGKQKSCSTKKYITNFLVI